MAQTNNNNQIIPISAIANDLTVAAEGRAGEVADQRPDANVDGERPSHVYRRGIAGHVVANGTASSNHAHPIPEPNIETSKHSYTPHSPRSSNETQVLTLDEVKEKPWKYIGYRGYSEFIASENDFFILRQFGATSVRVALMLQDRVTQLEEELLLLDRKYSQREAVDVNNGTFRDDEERVAILDRLRIALMQYNEFVLQQTELKKLPQPSAQDIRSLGNWHWNYDDLVISPEESNYLKHKFDLFSVVPKEKAPLRRLLERSRRFRINRFWKDSEKPELPVYERDVITYISDKRIDRFVTLVIIAVGMGMLIAPMWILDFLSTNVEKLACITAFIVAFLGMISFASVAKPYEILGATAAYSAVLMVFLQLGLV